jgi:hypothetical protein
MWGWGGGGAKRVRFAAKKLVKMFLFMCVRVTGNAEGYLN